MITSNHLSRFKYIATAALLKLFSVSPRFYRKLGNTFGKKKRLRSILPDSYGDRANQFISLCKKYNVVKDGDSVIEIGTGWVHFESIILKMFYDVNVKLFDVWDNRQFEALKKYSFQIETLIYNKMNLSNDQKGRIKQVVNIILKADSLEELYESLNFEYVISNSGVMDMIPNKSVDLVYSCNVLEHVDSDIISRVIQDFYRILKPGGYSIHKIDLSDHLISFANIQNMSRKTYLAFSDKQWKRLYGNKVQYINRIQYPEWHDNLQKSGLYLIEEQLQSCDIDNVKIDKKYRLLENRLLKCESLMVVHRKPLS